MANISASAVVRVLQNHFRTGASDLKRARLQIDPARETNLVHLESDAVLQAHTLLGGFDGLPAFGPEQGNDLLGGNERVAGGNAGPGVLGENRGSAAAEIVGRKRFASASWRNDNGVGRVHDFYGLISAPTRAHHVAGRATRTPPEPNRKSAAPEMPTSSTVSARWSAAKRAIP